MSTFVFKEFVVISLLIMITPPDIETDGLRISSAVTESLLLKCNALFEFSYFNIERSTTALIDAR